MNGKIQDNWSERLWNANIRRCEVVDIKARSNEDES